MKHSISKPAALPLPFEPSPPGVSVIVASRNPTFDIPHAVASVLRQTHPVLEIIVACGSGQRSDLENRNFADNVRLVDCADVARGSERVEASRSARFPFVAWLDAEHEWRPAFLSSITSLFAHLPEEVGIVLCNNVAQSEVDATTRKVSAGPELPGLLTRQETAARTLLSSSSVVVRRAALHRSGQFDNESSLVDDEELEKRLTTETQAYFFPAPLVRASTKPKAASTPNGGAPNKSNSSAPQSESQLPGVSVVIPAYNYAHYLPTAINSALRQDYPRVEVIVVDDGSTDNTSEITEAYGDRIRCIRKVNAGLSAARNTGIEAASHPFIAFLDADDEWLPNALSVAMREFALAPETLSVVSSQSIFMDPEGQIVPFKSRVGGLPREISFADVLLKSRFSPSSVVARKSVFQECGMFDPLMRSSEDRDMWIRIAAKHKVVQLRERLLYVRDHASSMSKNTDRMKANMRITFKKAFAMKARGGSGLLVRLRVGSFFHFQIAWMYFDEGRRLAALKEWLLSALLWPAFSDPSSLNEPPLFRLRSLYRFLTT